MPVQAWQSEADAAGGSVPVTAPASSSGMVSAHARRRAGPRKRNGLDPVTTSRLPEIAHPSL
jgi:hypothetical protein